MFCIIEKHALNLQVITAVVTVFSIVYIFCALPSKNGHMQDEPTSYGAHSVLGVEVLVLAGAQVTFASIVLLSITNR